MIREVAIISLLGFFKKGRICCNWSGVEIARNDPDDSVQLFARNNLGLILQRISYT